MFSNRQVRRKTTRFSRHLANMEFSGVTKSLYRKALKLAQKIESVSKKESAIKEIKQGFRENAREQDPER